MNLLVVGDVHGCLAPLKEMIENHWNPDGEFLILVGDIIQKGPDSAGVVKYLRKLHKRYPYRLFILKGNHEDAFVKGFRQGQRSPLVQDLINQLEQREMNPKKVADWFENLPLKWENPFVLITHAGVAKGATNPYLETNPRGVLHNRSPLKNLKKVQVFGHNVLVDGKIMFFPHANAWCIDTGAWMGKNLSALRLTEMGEVLDKIQIPVVKISSVP